MPFIVILCYIKGYLETKKINGALNLKQAVTLEIQTWLAYTIKGDAILSHVAM